jgi:hypothetical protein
MFLCLLELRVAFEVIVLALRDTLRGHIEYDLGLTQNALSRLIFGFLSH